MRVVRKGPSWSKKPIRYNPHSSVPELSVEMLEELGDACDQTCTLSGDFFGEECQKELTRRFNYSRDSLSISLLEQLGWMYASFRNSMLRASALGRPPLQERSPVIISLAIMAVTLTSLSPQSQQPPLVRIIESMNKSEAGTELMGASTDSHGPRGRCSGSIRSRSHYHHSRPC